MNSDCERVEKVSVISQRKLVEIERKRLKNKPREANFKEWLGNRKYPLSWMKKQFGETLTEKSGLFYADGSRVDEADCNICGRKVKPDERVIHLSFSCDEYACGMNICKKCLSNLSKRI